MYWLGIPACLLTLALAGCEPEKRPCCPPPGKVSPFSEPPVALPVGLRQKNYAGGSCIHASLISVMRWQEMGQIASWWREHYWGAEDVPGLAQRAAKLNLRYAYTASGDPKFLEWCSATRRGAAIHYYPAHAVTFCGYQRDQAILLDNNRVDQLIRVPKGEFIKRWKGYGGYALTVVYSPAPPKPWM